MAAAAESPSFFLPLVTYPDPSAAAPLARALDLAATLGGSVTALVHEVDIPPVVDPLSGLLIDVAGLIAAAEAQSRKAATELSRSVEHQARRLALPLTTTHVRSGPESTADTLALAARTHDFSLLLPETPDGFHASVTEAVLFGSGGPAFLFPANDAAVHLKGVAVAWDGSRAAARAVRDAIAVLKRARRVIVLTAGADKPQGPESLTALRQMLAGHGIACESRDVAIGEESAGDALQRAALDEDAGLLVMGAYGHSRFREFVLGGATRSALERQRLTILMSH
jgi:nucleotide-binding universal stress UspA family protein